tara:strand:- start:1195 stop:1491 length:297 start_codon:yes stop_codon:yes gene_type:complete
VDKRCYLKSFYLLIYIFLYIKDYNKIDERKRYETYKKFKNNFITKFLATWTAKNHEKYCMEGRQEELKKPPVEEAVFLADEAWKEYHSYIGDNAFDLE